MTNPIVVSITDELLAEIEQLAGKATPGPWNYDGSYVCTTKQEGETTYVESWNPVADALLSKNVHYIAKANPATILSLIKHIRSLEAELAIFKASDAQAIRWLAEIRSACGATHGMTFLEMVEHVRELRVDAERYRWLRDEALNMDFTAPAIMVVDQAGKPVYRGDPWNSLLCYDDADAAIDAARSSTA